MIDRLWNGISALAQGRTFFVLLLFFLVFSALFNLFGEHYPRSSFDGTRGGISRDDVSDILQKFSAAKQLDRYLAQETLLDLAFPAVYGLLFAVAVVLAKPKGWRWLVLLPLAMAFFDYCENFSFIALVIAYRRTQSVAPALAAIASAFSHAKWALVIPAFAAPFVALVRRWL